MSRYFSKIVLSLLIAAPLVLVPSFSANANPPANATSAPSTPHTPPPPRPPSNPLPNPSLAPKDFENSVTPPDSVSPIYEVDSNYMQSEIEELQAKVNAQDRRFHLLIGLLTVAVIILLIRTLLRSFKSKPEPQSASEEKPKYGLNV